MINPIDTVFLTEICKILLPGLAVAGNKLRGAIPQNLNAAMTVIDLENNSFDGDLPGQAIGAMQNLISKWT